MHGCILIGWICFKISSSTRRAKSTAVIILQRSWIMDIRIEIIKKKILYVAVQLIQGILHSAARDWVTCVRMWLGLFHLTSGQAGVIWNILFTEVTHTVCRICLRYISLALFPACHVPKAFVCNARVTFYNERPFHLKYSRAVSSFLSAVFSASWIS